MTPLFNPDSSLVADVRPSPNFGERVGDRLPDMILLHYTGMPEPEGALEWICTAASKVSAHYYVFEDGRIIQCVPEKLRAWHAGESFWANDTDINSCSIGIEIANSGHDHTYPDFPLTQMAAVTALCRSIIQRRQIPPERVLGHSDVAPGRKKDPGEKFPWHILYNSGVGYWVEPVPIAPGPDFTMGDRGDVIASFQALLAEYGYRVPVDGEFDQATRDAVAAFQRHFRPAKVDGVVDSSTLMTLQALIDSRDKAAPRARKATIALDEEIFRP
jgi:N-acetylmuramoyl-L-alanine amidase